MTDCNKDECQVATGASATTMILPKSPFLGAAPAFQQPEQIVEPQSTSTSMVRDCIALLHRQKIRCVAFDMDLTAVARHSRGRLRRVDLQHEYLDYAVPPFVELVPALHAAGIHVAITTHSDEAEFQCIPNSRSIHRSTHILGHELVQALLQRHVPDSNVRRDIFIVAYNPRVREDTSRKYPHKRFHMERVRQHFADLEHAHDILLLDDTLAVVRDCRQQCGVRAIQVSQPETHGLQWSDIFRLGTSAETVEYK